MKNKKKAVIYCRVATEKQINGSFSLDAQEKQGRELAKKRGCDVVKVIKETGSGLNSKRKGFKELKDYVRKNPVNVVYVSHDISRLSRKAADIALLQKLFKERGVDLITGDPNKFVSSDPATTLLKNIRASFAEFDSVMRSHRIRRALALKREKAHK